jgi:hypothetical protein
VVEGLFCRVFGEGRVARTLSVWCLWEVLSGDGGGRIASVGYVVGGWPRISFCAMGSFRTE